MENSNLMPLISLKQLPVIEERMRVVKDEITAKVNEALSLACTEETVVAIKKTRASLRAEYADLERAKKDVKAAILAPYEQFEKVYKECAGDLYVMADAELKRKIDEVESGLKAQKRDKVHAYYDELRMVLNIPADLAPFDNSPIKITLSASDKSLREAAATYLHGISEAIQLIDTEGELRDEIMYEYRRTLNASAAIRTVKERHARMEQLARERESRAAVEQQAAEAQQKVEAVISSAPAEHVPLYPPVQEVAEASMLPKTYSVGFKVRGSLEQLRALKGFLNDGGYDYAQL